jgi:signal transduction histidine kinase
VADEGDGFPADFAPKAFERFSRADESRGSGGAGLGLAIVAAVAEAHGGSATATNGRGGGAHVSIRVRDVNRERDGVLRTDEAYLPA